jgi:hypothetical protein
MEVLSVSPFRTGSVLWRSRPDRWTLTVICKGTYALSPGEAALAAEQEEVNERDAFWDDDPRRSVYAPSDLAPFKPRADVMLVGHAFAPRSELARALVTRLVVGELEKAIEVTSPRVWTREGELREGARWNNMPLRWEHAAGGVESWNPVGVSPNAAPDAYGQRLLPNLQPPGLKPQQWSDLFVPVGFGPISPTWTLRRARLGARAEGWSDEGWPQIPLDDDFDGEFFQAAPPDQQIEALHDDVAFVLEYLHPDHPRLATKLPGVHPHAFVEIPGGPPHDLVMTADTLWIDTDRALCAVTWRGQVAVDGPAQPGRVVIALEEPGQRLTWTMVSARAGLPPLTTPPADSARTPPHGRAALNTLPFRLAESSRLANAAHGTALGGQPTLTGGMLVQRSPLAVSAILPAPIEPAAEASEPQPTPRAGALPARHTTQQMTAAPTPVPTPPSRPTWRDEPEHTVVSMGAQALRVEVHVPPPAATAFEVLWISPALAGRLRQNAAWARLLSPAAGSGARSTKTMVSIAVNAESAEAVEHALETDAAAVLSRGAPSSADLEAALFDSTAVGGVLAPPLLLLSGELELTFDELALTRALLDAAAPLARTDAAFAEILERASARARAPLQHAPEAAAALRASVREAWSKASPELPADHLDQIASRAALAERAYQRRDLLGDPWIRALFTAPSASAVPAYLPEPAARRLPLFTRLPVRLLAEVVPQQDQHEEAAIALKVAAVARVVTMSRRREE